MVRGGEGEDRAANPSSFYSDPLSAKGQQQPHPPKNSRNLSSVFVKPLDPNDIDRACDIMMHSFQQFNDQVGLPPEFPPRDVVDVPKMILQDGLDHSPHFCQVFGLYRTTHNQPQPTLIGSNMIDYRDGLVAGIGPISVDPQHQNCGGGALLMRAVQDVAKEKNIPSVRLMQICSNVKSFSLYLRLGFNPQGVYGVYQRDMTTTMATTTAEPPAHSQFTFGPLDTETIAQRCSDLHESITDTPRLQTILACIADEHPKCVVYDSENTLVAYTTGTYIAGHTIATSEEAFQALIWNQCQLVAQGQQGNDSDKVIPPLVHVSHDYPQLARWLVRIGFRLERMLTYMSYGPHPKPRNGFYMPSISY